MATCYFYINYFFCRKSLHYQENIEKYNQNLETLTCILMSKYILFFKSLKLNLIYIYSNSFYLPFRGLVCLREL